MTEETQEFNLSSSQVAEGISNMPTAIEIEGEPSTNVITDKSLISTITTIRDITNPDIDTGQHYVNAQAQLQMSPREAVIDSVVGEYNDYYNGVINEMLVEESGMSTVEEAASIADGVIAVKEEQRDMLAGPDKLEVAQILALTGKIDKVAAERNYYSRKVAEMTDSLSTAQFAWDIVKTLAPGDAFIDAAQLTGGSVFDVVGDLKKFFTEWRSLPSEERMIMFPKLLADIEEVTDGNAVAAQRLASIMIDPTKDHDIVGEMLFDAMDIAGALSLAVSGANIIKNLATGGSKAEAARVNQQILADATGQVEEATGVNRVVAAANTSPFKFDSHGLKSATDDLSAEISKVEQAILNKRAEVQEDLTEIVSRRESLTESALTAEEQALAQERGLTSVKELQQAMLEQQGWHSSEAKIVGHTDTDFTIAYKVEGSPIERQFDYTQYDKTGVYETNASGKVEQNIFERWFSSPLTSIEKLSPGTVGAATRVNFAQDSMLLSLQKAATKIFSGLGSPKLPAGIRSRNKVNDVLLSGDEALAGEGKVFSLAELDAGIMTPNGLVKLSGKEQAAYYASRDYYDALHFMESQRLSESLRFQGFKKIALRTSIDEDAFASTAARPLDRSSLPTDLMRDPNAVLWSAGAKNGKGGKIKFKNLDVDRLYDEGFQMVRLLEKQKIGAEYVEFAMVKGSDIKNIGLHTIHKKTGYIPKEAVDGFYFVKQVKSAKVNGKMRQGGLATTVGRFATKQEADKFASQLVSGEVLPPKGAGVGARKVDYTVTHDRELTAAQREREAVNGMGGLFYSSRSKIDIVNSLTGETPRRINALEAMERQMGHVARNIPLNQYRMGIQQEWLNTYKTHLVDPTDFNSPLIFEEGSKELRAAEGSRTWIRDQMRIPTQAEIFWEAQTRNMAEWMEGKPVLNTNLLGRETSLRRGVQSLSHKDPFSLLRATTFHSLIGAGNPAQLWMQAQGTSMAMALEPLRAPQHLRMFLALRSGIFMKGSAAPKAMKTLEKAAGMKAGELETIIKEINANGLFKAIKSTADYAASQQSYGFTGAAIRDIADKALIFFREGEMVNRGFGYITARGRWQRKNPGKDISTQEAQKEILSDTMDIILNLNRSARAAWQKGPVGNTTQFWQVNAKFMETILPKALGGRSKFTGAEKSRLILGQLALYGGAGVPLGNWIAEEAAHAYGLEPGDMSPEIQATITDGFWGFLANELFGDTLNLGQRGGMMSSATDMIDALVIKRMPLEAVKTMMGASGSLPPRIKRVFDTTLPLMLSPQETDWSLDEFLNVMSSMGAVTSTWNNYTKAKMWYDIGQVRDTKGRLMFDIDRNEDMALVFAQALGFNPARLSNIYDLRNAAFTTDQEKSDKVNALIPIYLDYYNSKMDEGAQRNLALRQKWIVGAMSPDAIRGLEKTVAEAILNAESEETKQIVKAMERHLETGNTTTGLDGMLFNPEVGQRGAAR